MGDMKGHQDQIKKKLLGKQDTYNFDYIESIDLNQRHYYITIRVYKDETFVPPMYCDAIGINAGQCKVELKLIERDVYAFLAHA